MEIIDGYPYWVVTDENREEVVVKIEGVLMVPVFRTRKDAWGFIEKHGKKKPRGKKDAWTPQGGFSFDLGSKLGFDEETSDD